MRLSLMLLLAGLLAVSAAVAELPQNDTPENQPPLPRWQTLEEKAQVGPPQIATVTPPPANPVYLDGEFEPKEGILVRWPFYYEDIFTSLVDEAQDAGKVYIIVSSSFYQDQCIDVLADYGVGLENVEWLFQGTNAIWVRDWGPWFVEDEGAWSIVDMKYYPTRPLDDYVPEWLAGEWDYGYYGPNMYHEGGNMMNDGHGTIMMSTRVLDANPSYSQADIEDIYQDYFGQDNVHIFQRIQNDGTGHIDIWAKMVNDHTILVAEFAQNDVNYNLVEDHVAYMDNVPTHDGGTFDIVRVPMPAYTGGGYYRTHTNSVIVNNKVIIPTYGIPSDADAIAAYQTAMGPEYDVVGIDCNQIAPLGGELHCVVIEIPHAIQPLASVDLIPVDQLPVVPAQGGNFQFSAVVTNNHDQQFTGQIWTEAILPNGNLYGPVLEYNLNMPPNHVINTQQMSQGVPGWAPSGYYDYVAKIADSNDEIVGEDSFTFVKSSFTSGSPGVNDWALGGQFIRNETANSGLPSEYALSAAYPNPFNPSTSVTLTLPERADVRVSVFNVNGRQVATLANSRMSAGEHSFVFDASTLSSGVYFIQAEVPGVFSEMRKVTLLK